MLAHNTHQLLSFEFFSEKIVYFKREEKNSACQKYFMELLTSFVNSQKAQALINWSRLLPQVLALLLPQVLP